MTGGGNPERYGALRPEHAAACRQRKCVKTLFIIALTCLPAFMPGSVSSLDSLHSVSDAGYDSDEEWLLAQQEWEESLAQLQQLVSIVLLPFLGRWMGRKWSFWGERPPDFYRVHNTEYCNCPSLRSLRASRLWQVVLRWRTESFSHADCMKPPITH